MVIVSEIIYRRDENHRLLSLGDVQMAKSVSTVL
jgi:hypothetical protein